jgi:hypothetical protein
VSSRSCVRANARSLRYPEDGVERDGVDDVLARASSVSAVTTNRCMARRVGLSALSGSRRTTH